LQENLEVYAYSQISGPPYPYDNNGEKDHDFSLDRPFMPLSAPLSDIMEKIKSGEEGIGTVFLRALLVLIEEISYPKPLNQA